MSVHGGARCPGVALVDRVAMPIEQQRAVEMGAGFDGAFAVIGRFAAPEDHAAIARARLELEPAVKRVHRAAGEEVSELARAHDHFHADRLAAPELCGDATQRRDEFRRGTYRSGRARKPRRRLLADRERARHLRRLVRAGGAALLDFTLGFFRQRENVHAQRPLQEPFHFRDLLGVSVRRGDGGVRRRKTMGVNKALDVAKISGADQRHVAVHAVLRLRRIIERPRALARHAARLPVVVVVEAANPAIVVHRNIQVHLVTGRAELRDLVRQPVERFQEGVAMRLGIELYIVVVQAP